jgi:ABC-type uncharacterized transport system ATPase subunit
MFRTATIKAGDLAPKDCIVEPDGNGRQTFLVTVVGKVRTIRSGMFCDGPFVVRVNEHRCFPVDEDIEIML